MGDTSEDSGTTGVLSGSRMDNSSWRHACLGCFWNRYLLRSHFGRAYHGSKDPSPVHSGSRGRPGSLLFLLFGARLLLSCYQFTGYHHDALFPCKVSSGVRQRSFHAGGELPAWAKGIASFSPLTYFTEIARYCMGGTSYYPLSTSLVLLLIFTILFWGAAVSLHKRTLPKRL